MTTSSWDMKYIIDSAHWCAEQEGFVLTRDDDYGDRICITANDSRHGYASDAVLCACGTWAEAIAFFNGWRACRLAVEMGKAGKTRS